jgi:hypothetical protein
MQTFFSNFRVFTYLMNFGITLVSLKKRMNICGLLVV